MDFVVGVALGLLVLVVIPEAIGDWQRERRQRRERRRVKAERVAYVARVLAERE